MLEGVSSPDTFTRHDTPWAEFRIFAIRRKDVVAVHDHLYRDSGFGMVRLKRAPTATRKRQNGDARKGHV